MPLVIIKHRETQKPVDWLYCSKVPQKMREVQQTRTRHRHILNKLQYNFREILNTRHVHNGQ